MPGGASFLIKDQAKPVNEVNNKDAQDEGCDALQLHQIILPKNGGQS